MLYLQVVVLVYLVLLEGVSGDFDFIIGTLYDPCWVIIVLELISVLGGIGAVGQN